MTAVDQDTDGNSTIRVALAKDLAVDSVTTGDTVMNNGGITIGTGASQVALGNTGLNNGGNTITGVAPGSTASGSTEAINGGQLSAGNTNLQTVLGGDSASGVTYDAASNTFTGNNIGGTGQDNINDAIASANTAANAGWTVSAESTNSQKISPNGTVDFTTGGDTNLSVAQTSTTDNAGEVQIQLAKNLAVDSVNAGGTKISSSGLTFVDGTGSPVANSPVITASGINAGNQKITNVTAGSAPNDAVNFSQLQSAAAGAASTVSAGTNVHVTQTGTSPIDYKVAADGVSLTAATNGGVAVTSTPTTNADGATDTAYEVALDTATQGVIDNAVQYDGASKDSVTFNPANAGTATKNADGTITTTGGTQLHNVASAGDITDAANALNGVNAGDLNNAVLGATNDLTNKGLQFGANAGGPVTNKLGSLVNVKGADANTDATKFDAGANLMTAVDQDTDGNSTIRVALAKDLAVDSVTTGDTVMNNGGITIGTGASQVALGNTGLNNGGNQITNVASGGTVDSNAATIGDLKHATAGVQTHFYGVNNIDSTAGNYDGGGATGTNALAAGVGATAGGPSATAVGNGANAAGQSAVAVGNNANADNADSDYSTLVGSGNKAHTYASLVDGSTLTGASVAGEYSSALGWGAQAYNRGNTALGTYAHAGDKSGAASEETYDTAVGYQTYATGGASTSVGSFNQATGAVSTALGFGSIASVDASVALGAASTTTAADTNYYNPGTGTLAGTAASVVSVGGTSTINGVTQTIQRQIQNVAPGAADTDAVNVSQLKALNGAVTNAGLNFTGDNTSTVVHSDLGDTLAIKGGAADATTARNIVTTGNTDGSIQIDLAKDVNLGADGSVTTGSTKVDNGGLTITGGANGTVALTSAGLDNGGNKIVNVAAGTVGAGSTDAVNGGQLNAQGEGVKTIIGGTTTYDPSTGTFTNSDIGGTGKDNINDAIASANSAATAGWDVTDGTHTSNIGPDGKVTFTGDSNVTVSESGADNDGKVTVALNKDLNVDSVTTGDTVMNTSGLSITGGANGTVALTSAGLDNGGNKIVNVAAGTVGAGSTDAVNGGQLNAQGEGVKTIIGGTTTYDPSTGTFTNSDIGGTGKDNINDAIASANTAANAGWTVSAESANSQKIGPDGTVDFTTGGDTNLSVAQTSTTANAGEVQIQLAKNLAVDSVTTGDSKLDTDGLTIANTDGTTNYHWDGLKFFDGTGTQAGPSVTRNGIDAGDTQITNVASGGTTATNAANIGDVNAAVAGAETHFYSVGSTNANAGNYKNDGAKGTNSLAAGVGALAEGASWTATAPAGQSGSTNASNAVAVGNNSKANGNSSIAVGDGAKTAVDTYTLKNFGGSGLTSANAVAIGTGATTYGDSALALGRGAIAGGNNSIALGTLANVSNDPDNPTKTGIAIGDQTRSAAGGIHIGNNPDAAIPGMGVGARRGTTLIGMDSIANQHNDTVVGSANTVVSDNAAVLGSGNTVGDVAAIKHNDTNAVNASVLGTGNTVLGKSAIAIGTDNTVSGNNSGAFGDPNTVTGNASYAFGNDNTIAADNTFVLGNDVTAALGTDQAVAVGNAAQISGWGATAVGAGANAGSQQATAVGLNANAEGTESLALGTEAKVNNVSSFGAMAVGSFAQATGNSATAIGFNANASNINALALGPGATASDHDAVALGSGSATAAANQTSGVTINGTGYQFAGRTPQSVVSVGDVGAERQVTNVAAGRVNGSSTDAINGSQLYATNQAIDTLGDNAVQYDDSTKDSVTFNPANLGSATANVDGTITTTGGTQLHNVASAGDITNAANALNGVNAGDLNNAVVGATNDLTNKGLQFGANAGGPVTNKLGSLVNVKGADANTDATKFDAGANLMTAVDQDTDGDSTIRVALAKDLAVDSVTTGDTVMNTGGLSITGGANGTVALTNTGLNNGGNQITNVASGGTTATNAANIGDVNKAAAAATTTVAAGTNVHDVAATTNADGSTTYTVNAEGAKVISTDGNLSVASSTDASNLTTYNVGLKDSITVGTANPVTIDGSTGVITGLTNTTLPADLSTMAADQAASQGQLAALGGNLTTSGLDFAGDSGTTVHRNLGQKLDVKGGATGALTSGNIGVVANGSDGLEVQLAKDIDLGTDGSVKTGDTTVNTAGLSITGGTNGTVALTNTGLNNGGNQITNVASGGTVATNAANIGDVNKAAAAATTTVAAGTNVHDVAATTNTDGSTTYTVNAEGAKVISTDGNLSVASSTDASNLTTYNVGLKDSITVGTTNPVTIDGTSGHIGGLTNKTFDPKNFTSGQAASEDQLAALGGDLTNAGLDFAGNSGTAVHRKLGETLAIQGGATTAGTYSGANLRTVTDPTTGAINLQIADSPKFGDVVINDAGKITGVADGTVAAGSKDAVNGGQLNDVKGTADSALQSFATAANGTDAQTVDKDHPQANFKDGKNIKVTGDASGITIATADDVDFENVNVTKNLTVGGTTKLGDHFTVNNGGDVTYDGPITADTNIVNKKYVDDQGTGLTDKGMDFAGNSGTAVHRKLGETLAIQGGATTAGSYSGANLRTVTDPTTGAINLQIADSPKFGDVVINDAGKITGVADGTVAAGSKDAVNGGQLNDVKGTADSALQSFTTAANGTTAQTIDQTKNQANFKSGKNIQVTGDATGITVATADDVDFENVNVTKNLTVGGTTKLGDHFTVNNGGDVTYDGPITADTNIVNKKYVDDQSSGLTDKGMDFAGNSGTAVHRNLGETLAIQGGATTAGTYSSANLRTVTDPTTGAINLQIADSPKFGDVVINADGSGKITGVADGTVAAGSKDAVNGGQLNDVKGTADSALQSFATAANGVDAQTVDKDHPQANFIEGDNIKLTGSTDGIMIATAPDVTFDNLTVNNTTKLGDHLTVNKDGTTDYDVTIDSSTGGTSLVNKNYVDNQSTDLTDKGMDFAGNSGTAVHRNLGETLAIQGGATTAGSYSGANLRTVTDPTTGAINLQMADSPKFGDVVINDAGKITGVADGTVAAGSKDAVNGGQLNDVKGTADSALQSFTTAANGTTAQTIDQTKNQANFKSGKNIQVTGDGTGITVATADDVDFENVNVTKNLTVGGTTKLGDHFTVNNGGDVTYDGPITGDTNIVNKKYVDDQGTGLTDKGMDFAGNSGTAVHRKLGETLAIQGGATTAGSYSGANLRTVTDPTTGAINLQIADSPKFGDVVINADGSGKITGVADGEVAAGSKDAVNGGQLQAAGNSLVTVLGGNAQYVNNSYSMTNIGGTGKDNINDAIASANSAANAGWNLSAQGANSSNVGPNGTVDLHNTDGNIVVSKAADSNDVNFDLNPNLTVDSVTTGNTKMDTDGVTVSGGPNGDVVLGNTGLNNGGNQITGVASGGDVDTNAANIGDVKAAVDGSISNNPLTFAGDTGVNVQRKLGETINITGGQTDASKLAAGPNVGVVANGTDGLSVRLAKDVDLGKDGSVTIGDTTVNNGGLTVGNTTVNGSSVTVGGTTVNNNGVTIQNGPSMTQAGVNAGGQQVTNVADGVQPGDAVNMGQLSQSSNRLRHEINKVGRNADAGVASAIASANLPQPYQPGTAGMGASVGAFRGQGALAVGVSGISENGSWVFKGSLNFNSQGKVGAGGGFLYVW